MKIKFHVIPAFLLTIPCRTFNLNLPELDNIEKCLLNRVPNRVFCQLMVPIHSGASTLSPIRLSFRPFNYHSF